MKKIELEEIVFSAKNTGSSVIKATTLGIPTYNRPLRVYDLLNNLAALPYCPENVMIVDASTSLETLIKVRTWCEENRYSFNLSWIKSPKGLTIQRNVVLDLSNSKYIYFLDDDCKPIGNYFRDLFNCIRSSDRIGGVNGLLINEINKKASIKYKFRLLLGIVNRKMEPGMYYSHGSSVPYGLLREPFFFPKKVNTISGGACVWDREKVQDVGGFSEFFNGYSQGEDLEIALRISERYDVLWCGTALCEHNHEVSGRPNLFIKGSMEVYNRHFIWRKYSANYSLVQKIKFWADISIVNQLYATFKIIRNPFNKSNFYLLFGYQVGLLLCLFHNNNQSPNRSIYFQKKTTN